MTVFKCVNVPEGDEELKALFHREDIVVDDGCADEIDASHLTILPALIDPHVHFRVPGQEYKEDWRTASRAMLKGGYTTVFDMPNNIPSCISRDRLHEKKALINAQLQEAGFPVRYELYIGADKNNFDQLAQVRDEVIGIKVFMGSSTGDLLMDDDSSLHAVFSIASHLNLMVGIHAEDDAMIRQNAELHMPCDSHHVHSIIRSPLVAAAAIEKVISLVRLYGTRVYILHVSSIPEIELIRAAKEERLPVFAETSPHHLFLNTVAYDTLHGRAQMNPPLRTPEHQEALFKAIREGVIDTIGTDHAPHTIAEKDQPYGLSPSGVPGIETNLPLLLNAYNEGKLSLPEIMSLTNFRIKEIFNYEGNHDFILVDLEKEKQVAVTELRTKCAWSPFEGAVLKGWPVYAICAARIYALETL